MFNKDGTSVIITVLIVSAVIAAIGYLLHHWTSNIFYVVAFVLAVFTLFFFRDPERSIPAGENLLIAPADGKIIDIKKVQEDKYLHSEATQISIFLSLTNVHVNRIPANGKIEYLEYYPGEYLVAWHEKASELNERAEFGILHPGGTKIFFRQITGYVARRIVYHIDVGDTVKAGHRFGMMKFGSRMDILVPSNVSIKVKKGQKTIGGETIMGDINNQ